KQGLSRLLLRILRVLIGLLLWIRFLNVLILLIRLWLIRLLLLIRLLIMLTLLHWLLISHFICILLVIRNTHYDFSLYSLNFIILSCICFNFFPCKLNQYILLI